ncbi:MAG: hypothetical protein EXR60_02575 [Dehalococcoidia bacterium]|nr:hypothetical protein [Dehalococcoidia bacterium]
MPTPDGKPTRTETNLYSAIIGEGLAHMRYHAFAFKALTERHPEVAQIFLEVAGAETIHALSHLGVSGEVKSTEENLRSVVEGEAYEFETMYPNMVREAEAEGRADAAASFRMAMERERYHLTLFSKALEELQAKQRGQGAAATAGATPVGPTLAPAAPPPPATRSPDQLASAASEVERERWRVAALRRVRELVFGAQDGLLSTVALVTSVMAALNNTTTVIIAGLAAALAGMVSMATGSFLASRTEREVELAEIEKEARELQENPAEEMAELIAIYQREGMSPAEARSLAERIASDKDLWLKTLVEKELGLSVVVTASPSKDALVMGASFIVAALIPIVPYFFIQQKWSAIGVSAGASLVGLFGLGLLKGRLVGRSLWRSGLEIVGFGVAAAGLGYALGEGIPRVIGR